MRALRVTACGFVCLLAVMIARPIAAQTPTRLATSAEWLVASPLFFHGKQIVVRQAFTANGRTTRLDGTVKPVYIFWRERPARSEGEIRGEFWDLGRMQEGDSRFTTYDFAPVVEEA